MPYLEIRQHGRFLKRRPIGLEAARKGFKVHLGSLGEAFVKAGEAITLGSYELCVCEESPTEPSEQIKPAFVHVSKTQIANIPGESDRTGQESPPSIDGYQVRGHLGQGGMGTVWRALQCSTQREVALKLLNAERFSSPKARARFEREVTLAARLTHPNIARIYDSGLYHGKHFYVMELVEGLELDMYARSSALDRPGILRLMVKICSAVGSAHDLAIVHRDLKPSNILVTPDGEPHILDFGLAKTCVGQEWDVTLSQEGDITGTLAYMAPEQAAGRVSDVDERADVYSLGAILFQLLLGRLPHDMAGSRYELLKRIVEEGIPDPGILDPSLEYGLGPVVRQACALDLTERYRSARELGESLERRLEAWAGPMLTNALHPGPMSPGEQAEPPMLTVIDPHRGSVTTEASLSVCRSERRTNIVLLAKAQVALGRRRGYDVVTRLLPSDPNNDEKSLRIASTQPQCTISLGDKGVVVQDGASRNGTELDGERLSTTGLRLGPQHRRLLLAQVLDFKLHLDTVSLGHDVSPYTTAVEGRVGTLWTLATSARVNALVVQRYHNLGPRDPHGFETYCLLYRAVTLGNDINNALCFTGRGLASCHAALIYLGDRFYLENRSPENDVLVNRQTLAPGQLLPLRFGDRIQLAKLQLNFVEKQQLYLT